jgi:hypothetical protein
MSWKNLDHHVIAELIREQGPRFGTRAISDHARMRAAHPVESQARNWRAWVGRCISENNGNGVIPSLRKAGRSGGQQLWERTTVGSSVRATAAVGQGARSGAPADDADPLGPQSASDTAFTARMRLHQSRYRHERLQVPCGTGPRRGSTRRYGNMLRPEDAQRGCNFLTPEIFAVVQERLAQDTDRVEPFRLLHNMLSSQPMCFNLFGPLVRDHALASRLLSAMLGREVRAVDVRIEHSPSPAEAYLADRTSFDAYIEYIGPDGRGFVGIETKLTEPFSPKVYDRPEYRRWMRPGGPWRDPRSVQAADIAHNQLWRDHLLAIALRDHPDSSFVEGRLLLVRHPGDEACGRITAGYRELLVPGDETLADWPLDRLLEVWEGAAPEQGTWLGALRERYAVG